MKRLPWTLYFYLGKEILLISLFCVIAMSLLVIIVFGYRAVQEGFNLAVVMPWVFGCMGYAMFIIAPVSLLVASTLCFGRVAADQEYTALCAAGVSPLHIYAPMGAISLILAGICAATVGTVFPQAHYAQRNIARYLIKQLENMGKGKKRTLPLEDGMVYCRRIDGPHLQGVFIQKFIQLNADGAMPENDDSSDTPVASASSGQNRVMAIFTAESADVSIRKSAQDEDVVVLTLTNFQVRIPVLEQGYLNQDEEWYRYHRRISAMGQLDLEFNVDEKRRREGDQPTSRLLEMFDEHEAQIVEARNQLASATSDQQRTDAQNLINFHTARQHRAMTEIWKRRALAMSLITFPFLGFPISLTLRHRNRMVSFFMGSLITMLVFYPTLVAGETLAEAGTLPAPVAIMSGNVLLLGLAAFLSGRLFVR